MSAGRYRAYALGLLAMAGAIAGALKLLSSNSARCDARAASAAVYIAYCDSPFHGHYDHAALLYDLEPGVRSALEHATMLVLGDSRLQVALSSQALTRFEAAHPTFRPYLLGFGHGDQRAFTELVLGRYTVRPRVLVINVDPFFGDTISPHAQLLATRAWVERPRARLKQQWHRISAWACAPGAGAAARVALCGTLPTVFRSRADGRWVSNDARAGGIEASSIPPDARDDLGGLARSAATFLDALDVPRECVVLTVTPARGAKDALGARLALLLGTSFSAPALPGLMTVDGAHLDQASAERWSAAFLESISPIAERCHRK